MKKITSILILSLALTFSTAVVAQDTKKVEVIKIEKKEAPASQPVAPTATTTTTTTKVTTPVVATPATASTTTTEEMPWWKVLIRYGLELVFTLLGLLASVLVTVLMKKYGFENYSAKVNDVLARGVGYAEQKSLQALKLNGKPLASAEKLVLALDFVAEKAKEYKLPDKGKEWWTKKVEGWLGVQTLQNPKLTNGTVTPA